MKGIGRRGQSYEKGRICRAFAGNKSLVEEIFRNGWKRSRVFHPQKVESQG